MKDEGESRFCHFQREARDPQPLTLTLKNTGQANKGQAYAKKQRNLCGPSGLCGSSFDLEKIMSGAPRPEAGGKNVLK